jgi:hypothetical protein
MCLTEKRKRSAYVGFNHKVGRTASSLLGNVRRSPDLFSLVEKFAMFPATILASLDLFPTLRYP